MKCKATINGTTRRCNLKALIGDYCTMHWKVARKKARYSKVYRSVPRYLGELKI